VNLKLNIKISRRNARVRATRDVVGLRVFRASDLDFDGKEGGPWAMGHGPDVSNIFGFDSFITLKSIAPFA
jgi:hypothetical protein